MGVNIEPSPAGYIRMLEHVINNSCSKKDVAWCEEELKRVLKIVMEDL